MKSHNPNNERLKREYFIFLREARRRSEASIDAVAKSISRFEASNGNRDFVRFRREQAVAFKRKLQAERNARTGKPLSLATVHATLNDLRAFFVWLADRPGFRRALSYSDADYFNISNKDARVAKMVRHKPAPTLEQIHHVLSRMPAESATERRDRALIAFILLSGARDGAAASIKLKHLDIQARRLDQDARDVKTKFSKTFSTWFFPVGGEALAILSDWVGHLRHDLLWGDDDPLFPSTRMTTGPDGSFVASGLERKHWSGAGPIRRVFEEAFRNADLPYFSPHSFRHTLVRLGEQRCRNPEEFKSWSQNLGHEHVLTTFTSYGVVPPERQAQLMETIGRQNSGPALTFEERLARLEAVRPIETGS